MRVVALAVILGALLVPVQAAHVSEGDIRWACGFGGSGQRGHPSDCGIDPIGGTGVDSEGGPAWGAAWVDGDEPVLGLDFHGAWAVPVRMLDSHEVVNAEFDGHGVAITYCPLCGSGVAFLSDGPLDSVERLDFTASGFLYQSDLVMWDSTTGTLWNQITGTPIGALVDGRVEEHHLDVRLETVPLLVTTWDAWRAEHPGAQMLQPVRGSYPDVYVGYDESGQRCGLGTCTGTDGRLHPKEPVIGVEHAGAHAFSTAAVQAVGMVAHATDDGTLLVAVRPDGAHRVVVSPLEFTTADNVTWQDETGRTWTADDVFSGPGDELPRAESLRLFWFAWAEHHPDTTLWQSEGAPTALDPAPTAFDNGRLLGFAIPVVVALLILGAWLRKR